MNTQYYLISFQHEYPLDIRSLIMLKYYYDDYCNIYIYILLLYSIFPISTQYHFIFGIQKRFFRPQDLLFADEDETWQEPTALPSIHYNRALGISWVFNGFYREIIQVKGRTIQVSELL